MMSHINNLCQRGNLNLSIVVANPTHISRHKTLAMPHVALPYLLIEILTFVWVVWEF